MDKKRVKLSDIAAVCGVSVNTVSHALNDKSDISQETKKFIRKTADEMGYIHNFSASFLRSGTSKTIAVIIGDISNPHFSIMIKEIEKSARKNGYTAFVFNTDENEKLEKEAIKTAISKNADGIIICPVQKTENNLLFLKNSGLPFVLIGRRYDKNETNYVVCNDEKSGYIAAKYMHDEGKKKIAVLNAPMYISSARERLSGIKKGFSEYENALSDKDLYTLDISSGNHSAEMQTISAKGYDAAICFSDMIALELLSYTDIDVVSFDNISSKFNMPYKFKSITSSKTKMSNKAVEMLVDIIHNNSSAEGIILDTHLI